MSASDSPFVRVTETSTSADGGSNARNFTPIVLKCFLAKMNREMRSSSSIAAGMRRGFVFSGATSAARVDSPKEERKSLRQKASKRDTAMERLHADKRSVSQHGTVTNTDA